MMGGPVQLKSQRAPPRPPKMAVAQCSDGNWGLAVESQAVCSPTNCRPLEVCAAPSITVTILAGEPHPVAFDRDNDVNP